MVPTPRGSCSQCEGVAHWAQAPSWPACQPPRATALPVRRLSPYGRARTVFGQVPDDRFDATELWQEPRGDERDPHWSGR